MFLSPFPLQEFAAGQAGPDMCWFLGSKQDPFEAVTPPDDPPTVAPGNIYDDEVGYGTVQVSCYRKKSPTLLKFGTCGTRFGQLMGIHAPSDGPPPFTTWAHNGSTNTGDLNELGASMTRATVTSIRAGMSATESFLITEVCP